MHDLCPNLNHSRTNVPIRHCPTCGEIVNRTAFVQCNAERHALLLKQRHVYCSDCGVKLARK